MPRGPRRGPPQTTRGDVGSLRVPGEAAPRGAGHPGALGRGGRDAGGGPRGRRAHRRHAWSSRRRCRSAAAARPAASSSPTRPTRPRRTRPTSSGWTSGATRSTGCGSRRPPTSASEYYASVTFDRGAKQPLVMLSAMGGMDIEEVAASSPEALARLHVDPLIGLPGAPRALARLPRGHRRRGDQGRRRHPRAGSTTGFVVARRDAARDQPADPERATARSSRSTPR